MLFGVNGGTASAIAAQLAKSNIGKAMPSAMWAGDPPMIS